MVCMTQPSLTEVQKLNQRKALQRLQQALAMGTVQVVVARGTGAIALKGWTDNAGVSDVCAYRALSNTPEMRRAVARAETLAQTRVNPVTVASGLHSHDGGQTWSKH